MIQQPAAIDNPSIPRASPVSGAISPEAVRQLAEAKARGGKVRRAARVARTSGWSTAVFAVPSLLGGFFSFGSLLIGAALAVVARNEFRGSKMLERFDPEGARLLCHNQIGLGAGIVVYSLYSLYVGLSGESPYQAQLASAGEMSDMLASLEGLNSLITIAVYGTLIPAALVCQGGMAWYYASRRRYIESYRRETPDWIVDLGESAAC